VPFAKTGGLADVAGALPKAIHELGHDIRIAMPRYGRIGVEKFGLRKVVDRIDVPMDERTERATIYEGCIGRGAGCAPVYFVDSERYFDRQGIYMYPDDAERFIFFSRAALEMCRRLDWQPDVIHCNEWHTALIPNWLKTVYEGQPFYRDIGTLYTAHNLEYQGIFGHRVLEIAGLADMGFIAHPDVAPDLNYVVDLMARGVLFADIISTVSETYAREILTPEHGHGLDPVLRDHRDRLYGILNGIDTELYDPQTDPTIAARFDARSLDTRRGNKAALQAELRLPQRADVPVIGVVGRLSDQKGFDLITAIADSLLQNEACQLVVMGTGEMRYHDLLNGLAGRYGEQVSVQLTFNRPLEQRIYAGCDIFLMPSRFEPCGLNQMVAMRYGAVPVVHATGGLADTVRDYDPASGEGNGFSFGHYDATALFATLGRAAETYRHREIWRELQRRCMAMDFSWKRSAEKYVDLYQRALDARSRAHQKLAQ
jgi:starch synthase